MTRPFFTRVAAIGATLILSVSTLAGCSDTGNTSSTHNDTEQSTQAGSTTISAEDVKAMIDARDNVVVLDVRTPEEYAEGHVPTARNLSHDTINSDNASQLIATTDTPVVVYCRTGVRAQAAQETLQSLGYTNVKSMGGIMTDWTYDIVTD